MNDYLLIIQAGEQKLDYFQENAKKFFVKSIFAGVYLGIAMSLSLALGGIIATVNTNLAKIGFSMFFGLTFVLIIYLNGELFTGNCLTTIFPFFRGKKSYQLLARMWTICLLGNVAGICLYSFLFIRSHTLESIIIPYLSDLVVAKQNFSIESLIIKSILCNFIVCTATYVALKIKDDLAKTTIMLLVIMTFVLCGFDHCIANIGLFMMQGLIDSAVLNSLLVTQSISLSIIGNIIGGAILLAAPLYYILSTKKS